jgi:protein SCO1/2
LAPTPGGGGFSPAGKTASTTLARNGYLLDDPKNNALNINEQFLHTQFLALVDKGGRVRKIYDGLKQDELDELEKDITVLLKEKAAAPRIR